MKEYQYLLIRKAVGKSGWKALYVLPLVGISLSVTAETKVDYRYEVRNHESVADTMGHKGNENWYKVSSGEPTSFRKKNLEDGKIITDFENKMLTVIFYDKDGQQCKTRFVDVDPNEDIYIHNGAYANESVFNKVAAEEPESVIMVGHLKNGKKVKAVVTPSDVYLTGTVILREQEEDDPVRLKAWDAEGKEITVDPSKVLFVLDERPMPEGYSMNQINPDTIESIRILKTEDAQDKYGKYAENKDAIEISTKPMRFIPVSEPVGNLEEYAGFYLYGADGDREITYTEYLKIPNDDHAYHFVEHLGSKKYLHIYTVDYNTVVHLSKCKKTSDINDENLSWVNEKTRIVIDGKWDNYAGYLRTLKYQADKISEIEYYKYPDKKVKKLNLANNGFVSVVFNKEYSNEMTLVM